MVSLYTTIRSEASARANSCLIDRALEDQPPFRVTAQTVFRVPSDIYPFRFELDLPFSQARSVNLSDYDIYDEASFAGSQGSTENPFVFAAAQLGKGGYSRIFNICTAGQLENKEAARG